jgi:GTP 3',8-cyclase
MDVGNTNGWVMDEVMPASAMAARLEEAIGYLTALPPNYPGEVARRYRTVEGGEIGIIASVSQPFCQQCHRARLSSDGRLFTCLFAAEGLDLRGPLRAGASDRELAELITGVWSAREDRYSELRSAMAPGRAKVEMSAIGG